MIARAASSVSQQASKESRNENAQVVLASDLCPRVGHAVRDGQLMNHATKRLRAQQGRRRISPLGQLVARELKAREWTVEKLCVECGIVHSTVTKLIDGRKSTVSLKTALALAKAFGVTVDVFVARAEKFK